MAEPVSLAVLGAAVLTEGITFLYGQATELLKRRRERKDQAALVTPAADDPVLAGRLEPVPVDDRVLEERDEELITLTERLGSYVHGIRPVDPANTELIAQAEALRALLELAYRQRITFRGEEREPAGSQVDVVATAKRVDGLLVAARIDSVRGGRVNVDVDVEEVGETGTVYGFQGRTLG
jgi:hypothetical protein